MLFLCGALAILLRHFEVIATEVQRPKLFRFKADGELLAPMHELKLRYNRLVPLSGRGPAKGSPGVGPSEGAGADHAAAGDAAADECRRRARRDRRRRTSMATAADVEEAWHDEWRERLMCWWLAERAHTEGLGACVGALSMHLAQRFEALRAAVGRGGGGGGGGRGGGGATEAAAPMCDGLGTEPVRLPAFPEWPQLENFEFSLPPIPRSVSHSHVLPIRRTPRSSLHSLLFFIPTPSLTPILPMCLCFPCV